MYTPKIHESLIPCLYHAAQERKVPMTKLTDAIVYHELLKSPYGSEVKSRLPSEQEIVHPELTELIESGTNLVHLAHPFSTVDHLNAWYESAQAAIENISNSSESSEENNNDAASAIEHLQAAYIAASNLIRTKQKNVVNSGATQPA